MLGGTPTRRGGFGLGGGIETLFGERESRVHPLLLALTLVSCVLFAMEKVGFSWLAEARALLGTAVAPIHYAASSPYRLGGSVVEFLSTRDRLVSRNAELEHELLRLGADAARYDAVVEENDRLRELFSSRARLPDDVLIAELIEIGPNPARQEVVIDKGRTSGVAVGQPVIDSSGVFGQVVETTAITSRVLLVTDPTHAIPVQVRRNDMRAIASGGGGSENMLVNIPVTADIVVGDRLVSSGLGRRFPFGYPVGEVSFVVRDQTQQFAQVGWTPEASLDTSHHVLVVRGESQQGREKVEMEVEIETPGESSG